MKRASSMFLLAVTTALVAFSFVATSAADEAKIKGRYKIHQLKGNPVEGDVTEQADGSYLVENVSGRKGITITVPRANVRRLEALDEVGSAAPGASESSPGGAKRTLGRRRTIELTEIEDVLAGIAATVDPNEIGVSREDLVAPLPKNEERVREMHRMANSDKEWVTDHFVMVYTGPESQARALGARLERVWDWNVKFITMLRLPAKRPDHKLEVYFFHKYKDIESYYLAQFGQDFQMGVLGFFEPDINRSHFFDLESWPPILARRERSKSATGLAAQREKNEVNRWVDYQNIEVLQHEAGHHIHFNIGLFPRNGLSRESSIPRWLVEGTTMLFEFPMNSTGAAIGTINHNRLFQVRELFKQRKWSAQEWKMFLIDNMVFLQGGGAYYPVAWSMVNFLWHEHREAYGNYLRAVFDRPPDFRMTMSEFEKEFEDYFGHIDDKWIERFYKYLDSLRLNPLLLPPEKF